MPTARPAVQSHEFLLSPSRRTPAPARPPCLNKERALVFHLVYCLYKGSLLPLCKKHRPYFTVEMLTQWMLSYVLQLENVVGMETDILPGDIAAVVADAAKEGDKSSILLKLGDRYEVAIGGFDNVESLLNGYWEEQFSEWEMKEMCKCAYQAHEDVGIMA